MFRPRIIPVLLLKGQGLVKSERFGKYRYIGDPINAVKIFNDLEADELVFMDIEASKQGRCISVDFVRNVGEEANMPFAVAGGIRTPEQIREIISAGAEKVVLNTAAGLEPGFIRQAADAFGSSTIVVCLDVKKNWLGKNQAVILAGTKAIPYSPVEFAKLAEQNGAGELIVQSADRDGTMAGYDTGLLLEISGSVTIPVVALGGAGSLDDMEKAVRQSKCSAVAAGSLFVYHGERRGILINYPSKNEKMKLITG